MTNEIPEHIRDEVDGEILMGDREDATIDTNATDRTWLTIEEDGTTEVYWFDMKQISWERKTDVLDSSLKTDERTGEVDLDLKGYYREMMETVIVDSSLEGGLATLLKGMKPEVGDQLQQEVPQPGTVMDDVDEEGN